MPDDSPYRVKVMRLSDLKLDDAPGDTEPAASATPPSADPSPTPPPVPGVVDTGAESAPPQPAPATEEAVILDERIIGPAPQPPETPPPATAPTVPTPPVYTPPTPVGSTAASPTHAVSLNVPDALPSVEEASRKHALRPVVPLEPDEPIVVPKVFAPIARKASPKPENPSSAPATPKVPTPTPTLATDARIAPPTQGTLAQAHELPPTTAPTHAPVSTPEQRPTAGGPGGAPGVEPPVRLAPSAGGVNLSALRERVLHESANPTFHAQVQSIHSEAHTEGLAELRKAKLAGADLHELRNIAHEHTTAPTASPAAPQASASEPTQRKLVEDVLRTRSSPDTPLSTTHAAGIAEVAARLRTLPNDERGEAPTAPGAPAIEGVRAVSVPAMRTFRSDVEQTVMHNQTSVVGAIAAEEMRRGEESARIAEGRRSTFTPAAYLLLGMSIVLIVLGLGGVGAYLLFSRDALPLPDSGGTSLFVTDAEEVFDVTGKSRKETLQGLTIIKDQTDVTVTAVTQVHLTETVGADSAATLVSVSGSDFLKRIEAQAPEKLVRALTPQMMLGVHEVDGNQAFLILKTNFYENAFLGMLEWERNMNLDLAPLFGPVVEPILVQPPVSPAAATTTAAATATTSTSTAPTPEPGLNRYGYVDMIINNIKVRALKNEAGSVALLWSFPDQNTIIITTNRKTLEEVFTRMKARRYD